MRHTAKKNIDSIGKNDQKILPDNSSINEHLVKDFLLSFKSGMGGFVAVFTFILISKVLAVGIQSNMVFAIKTNDIIISFWGFLVVSFIQFSQRFR